MTHIAADFSPVLSNALVLAGLLFGAFVFYVGYKLGRKSAQETLDDSRKTAEMLRHEAERRVEIMYKMQELDKNKQEAAHAKHLDHIREMQHHVQDQAQKQMQVTVAMIQKMFEREKTEV